MRWNDKAAWVRSERLTHDPLVTEDVFEAAAPRLTSGSSPRTRVSTGTPNLYSLRGMLSCGICGRTMQGAFRDSRRKGGTGRVLYKCEPHKHRALPAEVEHPPSVYVREDAIIGPLYKWVEKLTDPEVLAGGQAADPAHVARLAGLRAELRDTKSKISKLIASIEAGIDPALIAPQIAARQGEKGRIERQIAAMNTEHGMSPAEIEVVAQEMGGLAKVLSLAAAEERLEVYESLQIKMVYEPIQRLVRAQLQTPTNAAWGFGRVRGGT
jgi:site-specific DNA recombinase